jgi:tetratricopeptide (TPR) repeat protein
MELADRLTEALGDRYRIEKEIGSGGMATVFLAHDLKHDRAVALKVLRDQVAQSVGAERFLQEIRIVAKLQHPHVLTLLDSGEVEGTLYYVMPYIEGESLREKLEREHELPVPDALRLLREVADALAFAHGKGVVHRDIKPDNVLLTGRHAVVADFGVSKALSAATGENKVTTLGVALGTPAYMAPEQAAADSTIDHRADIYALGILGYELLTGRPPFTGSTPQQILGAQVTETPRTVTEIRPAVPEAVSAVLMRCLEKRPADRWQTAEELRAQFEALQTSSGGITPTGMIPVSKPGRPRWVMPVASVAVVAAVGIGAWMVAGGGGGGGEVTATTSSGRVAGVEATTEDDRAGRIVVMEMENVTGDPSLDPLGRVGASWIERALTQSGIVHVVPLQSLSGEEAEAIRGASAAAVADQVRAGLVVTGEYYRRGEGLEVVAHILDPMDARTLFDLQGARGNPADPMDAFDEVAQRVVGAVAGYLESENARWMELRTPPPSLEVFRLTMEATDLFSRSRFAEALEVHHRMSELDTTWLSHKVSEQSTLYSLSRYDASDSVWAYLNERRDRLTREEQAHIDYLHAWVIGDPDLEYRSVQEMVRLDPLSAAYNAAITCSRRNRLEEALEHLALRDTTTEWSQNWINWDNVHWSVLVRLGRLEEALDVARRARVAHPESTSPLSWEVQVLAAQGRREEADALLEEARAHPASTNTLLSAQIMRTATMVAAGTGKMEDAAHYADLALAEASTPEGDTRYLRAQTLMYAGRWGEAESLMGDVLDETPGSLPRLGYMGWILANQGKSGDAAVMRERLASLDLEFFFPGQRLYRMAMISAALGEHDRAIRELQEAVSTGEAYGLWTIWYPWFTPLHDDPRYQRLVAPK